MLLSQKQREFVLNAHRRGNVYICRDCRKKEGQNDSSVSKKVVR